MYTVYSYERSDVNRKMNVILEASCVFERTLSDGICPDGIRLLEQFFKVSQYPNAAEVIVLAAAAGTTTETLKSWCK